MNEQDDSIPSIEQHLLTVQSMAILDFHVLISSIDIKSFARDEADLKKINAVLPHLQNLIHQMRVLTDKMLGEPSYGSE